MADSVMTTDGRTKRASDFFAKTGLYIGIGQTTAWTTDPLIDAASVATEEITELLAIKKIDTVKYVRAQTGGEITFNGSEWTQQATAEQTDTQADITITTSTIVTATGDFSIFNTGDTIKIIGTTNTDNDGYATVVTATTTTITVSETLIVAAGAATYEIKSNIYTNDIHHIYYEGILAYDTGSPDNLPVDVTFRQVGLLEDPVSGVETGGDSIGSACTQDTYLAASLDSSDEFPQGVLHYIDHRTPVTRNDSQREAIQLIIEF